MPRLLADPSDLTARGTLLWASTLALNDYQNAGRVPTGLVLHYLEHSLSGFSPDLAHGRGLATLYPSYFRWLLAHGRTQERFAQLGARLFALTGSEADLAQGFVTRFEGWLKDNGLFQSLADLGFADTDYPAIAEYAVRTYGDGQELQALGAISKADIVEIYRGTGV